MQKRFTEMRNIKQKIVGWGANIVRIVRPPVANNVFQSLQLYWSAAQLISVVAITRMQLYSLQLAMAVAFARLSYFCNYFFASFLLLSRVKLCWLVALQS